MNFEELKITFYTVEVTEHFNVFFFPSRFFLDYSECCKTYFDSGQIENVLTGQLYLFFIFFSL